MDYQDFVCDSCEKNHESVVTETKRQNDFKDTMVEARKRGQCGVAMLVSLALDVCPLIDSLNLQSQKVSLQEVEKALTVFSSLDDEREFDVTLTEKILGIQELSLSWREMLNGLKKNEKILIKKIKDMMKTLSKDIETLVTAAAHSLVLYPAMDTLQKQHHELRQRIQELQNEIESCVIKEVENEPFFEMILKAFGFVSSYFDIVKNSDVSTDEGLVSFFGHLESLASQGVHSDLFLLHKRSRTSSSSSLSH